MRFRITAYLLYIFSLICALPSLAQSQQDRQENVFPRIDHVIILDCTGSMSNDASINRNNGKKGYGTYDKGFEKPIFDLFQLLLNANSNKGLFSGDKCILVPACLCRKHDEKLRDAYCRISGNGLQVNSVKDSRTKLPGPCDDGTLTTGLKPQLESAMKEADKLRKTGAFKSAFTCYWLLTDNDGNAEYRSAEFDCYMKYITKDADFAEALFIPLGELETKSPRLALYALIKADGSHNWQEDYTTELCKQINTGLQLFPWPSRSFKREAIDLKNSVKESRIGENGEKISSFTANPVCCIMPKDVNDPFLHNKRDNKYAKENWLSPSSITKNKTYTARTLTVYLHKNSDKSVEDPASAYGITFLTKISPQAGWYIKDITIKNGGKIKLNIRSADSTDIQSYASPAKPNKKTKNNTLNPNFTEEELALIEAEKDGLNVLCYSIINDRYPGRPADLNEGDALAEWTVQCNNRVYETIKKHKETGLNIFVDFCLQSTVNFGENKQQSGFNKEILKLPNAQIIFKYLCNLKDDENTTTCFWVSDPPFILNLKADASRDSGNLSESSLGKTIIIVLSAIILLSIITVKLRNRNYEG